MPHKSGRTLKEPEYVASSTSAPFDPTGGHGLRQIKPYGAGSSAHSRGASALHKVAPHPQAHSGMMSSHGAKAAHHGQAPQASSLPGSLGIIEHPSAGRDRNLGIPGIISSTSLGPMQRQRLVSGIIESPMDGANRDSGAVHSVMGHDSTAYNEGMVHIRGSSFK
jgi:hypothetical protein